MRSGGTLAACLPVALVTSTLFSACATTARISDVYMSLDEGGERRRTVFFTDTREIHCLGEAGVGRPDVTIEAAFHQIRAYDFNNKTFFETDRYLGYAEIKPERRQDGPVKIGIQLGRVDANGQPSDDEPFAAGSYVCEMSLDGEVQGKAAFNIDFPPCPAAFIQPGAACFRYFPDGQVCPKYGEKSRDDSKCRCAREAGWECDPG